MPAQIEYHLIVVFYPIDYDYQQLKHRGWHKKESQKSIQYDALPISGKKDKYHKQCRSIRHILICFPRPEFFEQQSVEITYCKNA